MNEEIKAPEERFKAILNNIKEGYFEVDLKGNLSYFNDTLCNLTGYSKDKLLGLNFKYLTNEESRKKIFDGFNTVYKTGKPLTDFQYQFKDKDGRTIIGETSVYLKYDVKGNKIGFYGLFRDITKRKEEEEKFKAKLESLVEKRTKELRESEEKYRLITENANDIIGILNKNLIFEFTNEQASFNILGYKASEVIGRNVLDFLYPLDKDKGLKSLLKGIDEKEGIDEVRAKHKDGHIVWLEVKGSVFVNKNGEDKGILISRDITLRKEAELKLKESEEKFRTLTEQSFLGIAIIQDNLIKYLNEQLAEIFGYSIDEIMTWQPGEFINTIHPDDRNFVTNQLRIKQLGEPTAIDQYQFRGLKKNGDTIWLEVFSKTVNYKGRPADFVTLIDITEKKVAEEKLKKSEKEYREAFNRTNFYKDLIAHDINNILQNILSSVELSFLYAENDKKEEDLKRMLSLSKDQVSRGANLISNVRKLSELEEIKITTYPIEAIDVLNKSIEFLLKSYQEKKVNITIENPYKTIKIQGNELLTDVFENIISNAIKHNQNPSVEIKIKVSKTQKEGLEFVKFEFEDNGIGIPDVNKEVIFQRAYKTDKSVSGMGIGLSLVKKILNTYNGQIWVEDKVQGDYSKGSNFIVLIPEVEIK